MMNCLRRRYIERTNGKVLYRVTPCFDCDGTKLHAKLDRPDGAEKAVKLYRNARLVTIKGDDHCYTRHLNEVSEALKTFFGA